MNSASITGNRLKPCWSMTNVLREAGCIRVDEPVTVGLVVELVVVKHCNRVPANPVSWFPVARGSLRGDFASY